MQAGSFLLTDAFFLIIKNLPMTNALNCLNMQSKSFKLSSPRLIRPLKRLNLRKEKNSVPSDRLFIKFLPFLKPVREGIRKVFTLLSLNSIMKGKLGPERKEKEWRRSHREGTQVTDQREAEPIVETQGVCNITLRLVRVALLANNSNRKRKKLLAEGLGLSLDISNQWHQHWVRSTTVALTRLIGHK